jgi:hypothetical protein
MNRRTLPFALASLALLLLGFCVSAEDVPSHLMTTQGIVGGFVPAHVSSRIIITRGKVGPEIHVMKQEGRNAPQTFFRGTVTEKQYEALFAQAKKLGLWDLPREMPPGSEDIYQMDASINARYGKLAWRNGGPAGCVRGRSTVRANADQRRRFKELFEALAKFASTHAKKPSDAKTFQQAYQLVQAQTPRAKPKDPKGR